MAGMKFVLRVATLVVGITVILFSVASAHDTQETENNIAFELPDLATIVSSSNGVQFQIEAYKSINNDRILRDLRESGLQANSTATSQLFWVSIGQPMLCKTGDNANTSRLFHFTKSGFHTHVQMLTPDQITLLASTAMNKYHVRVKESQIVHLILSNFKCFHELRDEYNNKVHLVQGEVTDFRSFPLRMDFKAPSNSIERKLFMEELGDSDNLRFKCSIASRGKLMKTNTLKITSHQMQVLGVEEKLFGPTGKHNDSVYVTRDQMTSLSSEMYSDLNIVEDYQMPETQFTDAFVEGLINQIATTTFTHVPIQDAMRAISAYGMDFSGDLKADEVIRDMGEVLKVESYGNQSRIVVDESKKDHIQNNAKISFGASANVLGIVSGSVQFGIENDFSKSQESRSLQDQLTMLNRASQDHVKWEIQGSKVIPKSINVARVSRSKMSSTLTFNRIRVHEFNAAFSRQFSLYSHRWSESNELHSRENHQISQFLLDLKKITDRVETRLERAEIAQYETTQLVQRVLQETLQFSTNLTSRPTGCARKLTMTASQQTTYRSASSAIDGDFNSYSCTTMANDYPWWSADVGEKKHVTAVHIYADSNTNFADRYDNFRIWLSNNPPINGRPYFCSRTTCTLCYQHRGSFPVGGNARLKCEDSLTTNRYVIIQSSKLHNAICLVEVQVYGD